MQFQLDHVVAAPVDEVFEAVSDISQRPKWVGIAQERTQIGDGPVGAGTQFRAVDKVPGRTLEYIQTIDRIEENQFLEESWDGPMGGHSEIRFQDNGVTTTLSVVADVSLPVPSFLSPLAKRWATRTFRKDLERLSRLVVES